ncbi:uncharacterized protein FYN12_012950 [Phoenicopterus ruber ruber]
MAGVSGTSAAGNKSWRFLRRAGNPMGRRASSALYEVAQTATESRRPLPHCFGDERDLWGFGKGDNHLLFCCACQPKAVLCRYLRAFQREHEAPDSRRVCPVLRCAERARLLASQSLLNRHAVRVLTLRYRINTSGSSWTGQLSAW